MFLSNTDLFIGKFFTGKALLGAVSEQVMVLPNIGTSVLVSENQVHLSN